MTSNRYLAHSRWNCTKVLFTADFARPIVSATLLSLFNSAVKSDPTPQRRVRGDQERRQRFSLCLRMDGAGCGWTVYTFGRLRVAAGNQAIIHTGKNSSY